jgi:hypothetical protein
MKAAARRTAASMSGELQLSYLPFRRPWVPDVGRRLQWLRRANRMVLLEDGFPGRLKNGRLLVHPMDGRYLLEALMDAQEDRPRRRLHAAIGRTARAVIGRAEALGEALVLRYVDTASSMADGAHHISGLPQAYYATALTRAARLLDDDAIQDAADRFFRALLVPVAEGGALYADGASLAQVPTRPRDLILNGWLSMLVSVHRYSELRDSDAARDLFAANLPTLRRLLPQYDVPELRLSRYGLTGPLQLRLEFSAPGVRVTDLRIDVPAEGVVRLPGRSGRRWTPRAEMKDVAERTDRQGTESLKLGGTTLRCTAVLSRAGHPRPNRLRFRLTSRDAVSVTTSAHIGRYDADASSTVERQWVELEARHVGKGTHAVAIDLPYGPIDLFAYPTHFTRGAGGARVNAYHGTHIVRLRELAAITGDEVFAGWADRWAAYVAEWPDRPELKGGICWTPEGDVDVAAESPI